MLDEGFSDAWLIEGFGDLIYGRVGLFRLS